LQSRTGQITKAENIKANLPKILKPTHFSSMKNIKANPFLIATDINAGLFKSENKAKYIDKYKGQIKNLWILRPTKILGNQILPDLSALFQCRLLLSALISS
jgi:hypothetical protein